MRDFLERMLRKPKSDTKERPKSRRVSAHVVGTEGPLEYRMRRALLMPGVINGIVETNLPDGRTRVVDFDNRDQLGNPQVSIVTRRAK